MIILAMVKKLAMALATFTFLFGIVSQVYAASLALTHIGTLATNGLEASEWSYESPNPLLKGTAPTGAAVSVAIGTGAEFATTDTLGNWTYQTTLPDGSHEITISSDGDQYVFTLNIGEEVATGTGGAATTTGTLPADVPVTGARETTLALIAGAGLLIFVSYKLVKFS